MGDAPAFPHRSLQGRKVLFFRLVGAGGSEAPHGFLEPRVRTEIAGNDRGIARLGVSLGKYPAAGQSVGASVAGATVSTNGLIFASRGDRT